MQNFIPCFNNSGVFLRSFFNLYSSKKLKAPFKYFIPAIIWFIISFILLTLPGKDIPQIDFLSKIHFDKWVHTGMFGLLVFLFSYPLKNQSGPSALIYFFIFLAAWVYGIAMEYVQKYYIPNRSFDIWDIAADGFGSLLGYLLIIYLLKKSRRI